MCGLRSLVSLSAFNFLVLATSAAADELELHIAALRSGDLSRQVSATEELAKLGPRAMPALPALLETLKTAPLEVREGAARVVQAIGPSAKEAIPELIKLLADEHYWVRDQAAESLVAIGEAATPLLIGSLKSKAPGERAGAALALGRMKDKHPDVLTELLTAVKDPDIRVRATVAEALVRFIPEALPALAATAGDDEATVAAVAIECLQAHPGQPELAVPALAKALAKPALSWAAAKALEKYGTDAASAVPALVRSYPAGESNPYGFGEDAVTEALKHIGPARPEDAGALQELLKHKASHVRAMAAQELGKLPESAESEKSLRSSLSDPVGLVRVYAARALWNMKRDSAAAVKALESSFDDGEYDTLRGGSETLAQIGKPAVPACIRLLEHKDPDVRWWVADALGMIGADAAEGVPALIDHLNDQDSGARDAASRALSRIGPPAVSAVPHLVAATKSGRLDQLQYARSVIGMGPKAIGGKESLIQALESGEELTRANALSALCEIGVGDEAVADVVMNAIRRGKIPTHWGLKDVGSLGPCNGKTVPFLLEYLKSGGELNRESAAQGLLTLGPDAKPALDPLRAAAADGKFAVRLQAAYAVWRISGDAAPLARVLEAGFREPIAEGEYNTYYEQRVALSTVADMKAAAKPLIPALILALESPHEEIVVSAAQSLGNIGSMGSDAVPALNRLAKKTDWPLRQAALEALKKIHPAE